MKKKFFLAVFVAFLSFVKIYAQDAQIYATQDLKAQPGDEQVSLSLSMRNQVDIASWSVRLILPDGISLAVDDEGYSFIEYFRTTRGHNTDEQPAFNPDGYQISVYGKTPLTGDDGKIVNIPLNIAEDIAIGNHDIKLVLINFSDPSSHSTEQEDLIIPINIYAEYNISAASANEEMGTVELVGGGEAVESGTSITATATAKDGYEFVNWTNAAGAEISTENPYKFTAEKNIGLYAFFKPKNYDVNFQVDGVDNIQSLPYGSVITAPENPTKTGYTFIGWYPAFEEGATVPLNGITYFARWSINQYTLTFDTDGGSAVEAITQNYATEVTAPENPTKTGYTFVGWDTAVPETMPAENKTIKAVWQINQYTITFQTDGGTEIPAITQDYATEVTAPEDPVKEGHTFQGWDKDIPANMPAENMTITAKWKINQYTITFDTDGGSEVEPITLDYNGAVTAPAEPTKTGYTFVNWDIAIPENMPADNMIINAIWQINQYTLTFQTDGGTEIPAITQDYGTEITAPAAPTKEGHTFLGWDKDIPANMPAENVTITATWKINEYTFTFDSKGGSEVASITLPYGSEVTAPENPTREGYTFGGWDTEIPATMLAEDKTFTAQWTINQYEVIFKAGENYFKSFVMDYGTLVNDIIPEDVPQTNEEGLPFVGWEPVIDENTIVPAHDVTYVAVYSGQFTIKFNTNGGEEMAPIMMEYNAEIGEISDPVRPYYTFSGWTITDEKGKTYDEMPKNMPAANLTLTANWDIDINALKADLMAFLDGVEAPAVSTEAEVYINTDYDYYAVRKAIEDASAALEATDPAEVTAALDQAKVALNPYIEYCKKYGPAVSCEYALSENWGTIILPFDFVVPQGCTIFTCEGLKEDNLTLDIRVQYTGSKFTPYIMCGTAGQHMQFIGHIKGTKYSHVQYGIMVGVVDRAYTPLTGDYVMQNQQGVIGFYRVNRDTNNPLVDPYHCYLSLPNSKAKVIRWEGITDGIEMVDAEAQDGQTIYNLQGQRLQRQTKGINIVNGKKVLNK